MTIPTPETVRQILEAAEPRFHAFIGLCALAGLRLGEAAAWQVTDVDFLRREINVRRQVHDHPDDVRPPVAQRREPGSGRVSTARGRGPRPY